MRYYLDCEFNSFGGRLMSLALVTENGKAPFYAIVSPFADPLHEWVKVNVAPILMSIPEWQPVLEGNVMEIAEAIREYLKDDPNPLIITDWPDDIRYFCDVIVTGPGQMVNIPALHFELKRVDAYPTNLPGAIQHNALWDAMALREKVLFG